MSTSVASRMMTVALVAQLAPAGLAGRCVGASRATCGNAVASRKPLTTQYRSQWGHRGHPGTEEFGNDVSSNRGSVARSILYKVVAPVAPLASALIRQRVRSGHLDFVSGPGGPCAERARAPPDIVDVTGLRA